MERGRRLASALRGTELCIAGLWQSGFSEGLEEQGGWSAKKHHGRQRRAELRELRQSQARQRNRVECSSFTSVARECSKGRHKNFNVFSLLICVSFHLSLFVNCFKRSLWLLLILTSVHSQSTQGHLPSSSILLPMDCGHPITFWQTLGPLHPATKLSHL